MNSELKQRIDQYQDFPWESLLRKDLGRYSLEEVEGSFIKTKSYFDTVLKYQPTKNLPEQYLQILHIQLNSLFEFGGQVQKQFQNVSERMDWINRVKQFEYNVWNALNPIIEYIRFAVVDSENETKQLDEKLKKIESVGDLLSKKVDSITNFETHVQNIFTELSEKSEKVKNVTEHILQDEEKYNKAREIAENWIRAEGKVTATVIVDKSKIFDEKANTEHFGKKVWLWLVGVLVFAVGAILSAGLLIWKLNGSGESLSVGAALLRISVVGMFFSLAYLCYQQFSIQRRLYEIYKFKAIALSTMESLIKSFSDPTDRQLIVSKAIEIVFSEPSFKEDKVAHQRVIDELLDVIKKKI